MFSSDNILNYKFLDFKITPNNKNNFRIQIETILEILERNSNQFQRMGIRMNVVTKMGDGSSKTLGGPYGSTFLHLKNIKRSEEELSYLINFINDKILFSKESYENSNLDFESVSYLSSIYISVLEPVTLEAEKLIIEEYNSLIFNINYPINAPNGKRTFHTIRSQYNPDAEQNEKNYNNFVNLIVLHDLIPENFYSLINVKNIDENIYNEVIEVCMGKNIKLDFSSFRNHSRHRHIKIRAIWKHIKAIRVMTLKPSLTDKKLLNYDWNIEIVNDHNNLYDLKEVDKSEIKLWYLLLTKQSLYIPTNNLVKSIWEIGEYDLTNLALSGYTKCVESILGNCRNSRPYFISDVGIGIFHKHWKEFEKIGILLTSSCNTCWGVFDVETTAGVGEYMIPYACGVKIQGNSKLFYGEKSIVEMVDYLWEIEWYTPVYNDEIKKCIVVNKELIEVDKEYDSYKCLMDFIDKRYEPVLTNKLTLLAHNASRFDSNFILGLYKLDGTVDIIMRNSQILSVTIKKDCREIRIIDSMQHLVGSLVKVSKDFGVEENKGIFPYTWYNEKNLAHFGEKPPLEAFLENRKEEEKPFITEMWNNIEEPFNAKSFLENYLEADLNILENTLEIYIRESIKQNGINPINYIGAPSYSNIVFRSNHLNDFLYTEGWISEMFVRRSYFGGRNEIFKFHAKDGYVNDINSSYPWSMTQPMPIGKGTYYRGDTGKSFGFIRANVYVDDNFKIPILPVRKDGLLIFPTGSFSGTWFSEELNYAEENGYKVDRIEGIMYEKSPDVFKSFIDKFYKIKSESENSSQTKIAKLILNSLYGKLGSRDVYSKVSVGNSNHPLVTTVTDTIENTIVTSIEPGCIKQDDINTYLDIKNTKIVINPDMVKEISKDKRTNVVQLASAITAYSRIKLHKAMSEKDIGLLYVDTDSVFSEKGLNTSYIGDKLGEWDIKNISDLWICNNKMYSYKSNDDSKQHFAFKGIRDTSIAKYCELLVNGKVKHIMSKELIFKRNDFTIKQILMDKKTQVVYSKRNVISIPNDVKTSTYTCFVDSSGVATMIKNEKLEYTEVLVDTTPKILDKYDSDLVKEDSNVLTHGFTINI